MELSYKEEVGVGALVVAGLIAFTIFMFWLTGRSITSKGVPMPVEFKNVSGLKSGDPARAAGGQNGPAPWGRFSHVRSIPSPRPCYTSHTRPGPPPHPQNTS